MIGALGLGSRGPVIRLVFGGQLYVIPFDAVAYLGHGLDMGLFDVTAVAGMERTGALPVRVTYSGRVPNLPGLRVARASAGVASGYMAAASARTFGRALAKLWTSDRVRGRFGTDGMFAGGVQISLAGTRPVPAARPAAASHTLIVRGINAAGKPDTGDGVVVANVDDPNAFGNTANAFGTFQNGIATFSVPAGTYWALRGIPVVIAW